MLHNTFLYHNKTKERQRKTMNKVIKNMRILSLLLAIVYTYTKPEVTAATTRTYGFYELKTINILKAKISELMIKYTKNNYNHDNEDGKAYEEAMSFMEKITTKINTLAKQVEKEHRDHKILLKKASNISAEEARRLFLAENKSRSQEMYTLDCLETLNNQYFLTNIENSKILMNEILACIDAAEHEAKQ